MDAYLLNSFHEVGYEKYLYNHIKSVVAVAKESYRKDLDKKRQRLRELLEADDLAYENEFRQKVQDQHEKTIKDRQITLLKIRNEKVRENEEFLARKKAQKLMENSDKIRQILSQNLLREAKACNLAQIEDKAQRRLEADRLESMWLSVQNKSVALDEKRQEHENAMRKQMASDDQNYILQQMALQNYSPKEDSSSEFKSGTGSLFYKRQSEEEKMEIQRKNNRENQKEMLKYKELRQHLLDANAKAENRIMRSINEQVQEKIPKEQAHRDRPRTAKLYLDYCNEIKLERARELAAEEELIRKQQMEYECRKLSEYRKCKEEQHKKKNKTHDILLGQLSYRQSKKYNDAIAQHAQNIADSELWSRQRQQIKDDECERLRTSKKCEYVNLCLAAQKEMENNEEKLKDQDETRKLINQNDVEDEVALQLISKDDRILKSHANWKMINCECKEA